MTEIKMNRVGQLKDRYKKLSSEVGVEKGIEETLSQLTDDVLETPDYHEHMQALNIALSKLENMAKSIEDMEVRYVALKESSGKDNEAIKEGLQRLRTNLEEKEVDIQNLQGVENALEQEENRVKFMKTVPDKVKAQIKDIIDDKISASRAEVVFDSVVQQCGLEAWLELKIESDMKEKDLVREGLLRMKTNLFNLLNAADNETRIQAFTDFGMESRDAIKLTETLHGCCITSDEFDAIKDEMRTDSTDNELNALVLNKLNTFDSKSEFLQNLGIKPLEAECIAKFCAKKDLTSQGLEMILTKNSEGKPFYTLTEVEGEVGLTFQEKETRIMGILEEKLQSATHYIAR